MESINLIDTDGTAVLEGPTDSSSGTTLKTAQRQVSSTNTTIVEYYYTSVFFDATTNVTVIHWNFSDFKIFF